LIYANDNLLGEDVLVTEKATKPLLAVTEKTGHNVNTEKPNRTSMSFEENADGIYNIK
jgi:hypothetical protein